MLSRRVPPFSAVITYIAAIAGAREMRSHSSASNWAFSVIRVLSSVGGVLEVCRGQVRALLPEQPLVEVPAEPLQVPAVQAARVLRLVDEPAAGDGAVAVPLVEVVGEAVEALVPDD